MADDRRQPYQGASPRNGSERRQSGYVQDKRGLNTCRRYLKSFNRVQVRAVRRQTKGRYTGITEQLAYRLDMVSPETVHYHFHPGKPDGKPALSSQIHSIGLSWSAHRGRFCSEAWIIFFFLRYPIAWILRRTVSIPTGRLNFSTISESVISG